MRKNAISEGIQQAEEHMEIFESPQYTFPTEFKLDDNAANIKAAQEILADSRKVPIEKFEDGRYTLYELPRSFVLIDHKEQLVPKIIYVMKFKEVFHKFIGKKCAQQIVVWRNKHDLTSVGIAKHIFFDYLLDHYIAVITDSKQTPDGEGFWSNRLAEALDLGYYLYYVNLIPNREIVPITNKADFANLAKDKEIWGDAVKQQARRIVISTLPLL